MISTFVVNGKTQLVLTPADDKERALLFDLFSRSIVISPGENVHILNKNHPDSFIISQQEEKEKPE